MRERRGGVVAVDPDGGSTSEASLERFDAALPFGGSAVPASDLLWEAGSFSRVARCDSPAAELPPADALPYRLKRGLDLIVSAVLFLLAAPLLLAIAAAIRLESRGPVLFRQARVGLRGRRFVLYKFRTMRRDAEDILHADPHLRREYVRNDFKLPIDRDPRVTRLGRFLRRTSLDELPQLVNVLKGEMSLVGPRPVVKEELRWYGTAAPLLLSVRPGITGLWQVSGRNAVGYPGRARLELEYVREWSLWRDVRILLRTPRAVLALDG